MKTSAVKTTVVFSLFFSSLNLSLNLPFLHFNQNSHLVFDEKYLWLYYEVVNATFNSPHFFLCVDISIFFDCLYVL